jgi:hypothetical protein
MGIGRRAYRVLDGRVVVSNRVSTSTPKDLIPTIVGLLVSGVFLGAFYGLDLVSGLVLDLVFFGALVVFVPWAVWKLDPSELAELRDRSDNGQS